LHVGVGVGGVVTYCGAGDAVDVHVLVDFGVTVGTVTYASIMTVLNLRQPARNVWSRPTILSFRVLRIVAQWGEHGARIKFLDEEGRVGRG
jgi:hypothetical protein